MITIEKEIDIKKRLDIFLVEYLEKYQRSKISSLIEEGFVFVNGKIQKPSYKIKLNDKIELKEGYEAFLNPDMTLRAYDYKLDIIFEDDYLMVINKPKDMLCHPTKYEREKTLVNALLAHCPNNLSSVSGALRQGIVHRLDKNTSGLMLVAKTDFAHENLAGQIREKTAIRKYMAIALGEFNQKEGTINKPLIHYLKDNVKMMIAPENEGLEAITNYKIIEEYKGAALIELELKTGRTHQIRAHMSSINHPIFGDSLYGANGLMRNEFYNLKTQEQLLQSYFLSFEHPKTKDRLSFQLEEKDFSKDFIKVLNFLRSKNATVS